MSKFSIGQPRRTISAHRRAANIGLLSAILAFALALGGEAGAQNEKSWSEVAPAAKSEGKLVVYMSTGAQTLDEIFRRFEARYGVEVVVVRSASNAATRERIRSEQTAGKFLGDIIATGSTIRALIPLGQVEKHGALPNIGKIRPPAIDDGYFVPYTLLPHGLIVNTNAVSAAERPRSWSDLLDPKWRGKIIAEDPRAAGPGNVTWSVLYDRLGRDYIDKLAKQDLTWNTGGPLGIRRVAQGEFSMLLGANLSGLFTAQGLPVEGHVPSEGAPMVENVAGPLKNTPHPNATRLFLNFLLEDEAQQVLADQGLWSVTGHTSTKTPENMRSVQNISWAGTVGPERMDEMIAIFKEATR